LLLFFCTIDVKLIEYEEVQSQRARGAHNPGKVLVQKTQVSRIDENAAGVSDITAHSENERVHIQSLDTAE
tara:strand:- start:341 stop:553 length:213 start_codon:yes stop_codon:yes gene_type:complete